MTKPFTIHLSDDLEQQLSDRAAQLNISIEAFILESLAQLVQQSDPDDTPKEVILASLQNAFEDVKAGRIYSIQELWNVIGD